MNKPNLNYHGGDWAAMVAWLLDEQQTVYQRLTALKATNDETQQLRGRAALIAQLLGFKDQPAGK